MALSKVEGFTIGRLASEVGVNLETVRFYEREGLLEKPPRNRVGYRMYPAASTRRLRFIKRAKDLGFSLNEIRELLALRASPPATCTEIRQFAETKLVEVEGKIRTLESMRESLRNLVNSCPGEVPLSDCPILECLDGDEV